MTQANIMKRQAGYYWVRYGQGPEQIAEWTQTDKGEWAWAVTGCGMALPDKNLTVISGPLSPPLTMELTP